MTIIVKDKALGDLTELTVATEAVKAGYNVLFPFGDRERYDMAIDVGGCILCVQVKTCAINKWGSGFTIDCRTGNHKDGQLVKHHYTSDEVEYMATAFEGKAYLIPIEECYATKTLRFKASVNCKNVSWAQDYELSKVLGEVAKTV